MTYEKRSKNVASTTGRIFARIDMSVPRFSCQRRELLAIRSVLSGVQGSDIELKLL